MTQLHETIASDQYWNVPAQQEFPAVPFFARVQDVLRAPSVMADIDRLYYAAGFGHTAVSLAIGEQLVLPGSGAFLKVVEDMRTQRKDGAKPVYWRRYDTPEEFDKRARQMVDTTLFPGVATGAKVEGPKGDVDVARRVVYVVNSPSGMQLAGKESHLISRGGDVYEFVTLPPNRVGHAQSYETRKERVQRRVVSAEVITPTGLAKARARRSISGFKPLGPKISPASAC